MPLTNSVSWVHAHPVGCCWWGHQAQARRCWHVQWQVGGCVGRDVLRVRLSAVRVQGSCLELGSQSH